MSTTAASPPVLTLGPADAGELLTLQRAAYVTEAQNHHEPNLPPLTEPLDGVVARLARTDVVVWGVREAGRLIAAVHIEHDGPAALLGRLVVAPDRQGEGLGSGLLRYVEAHLPDPTDVIELFTGEHSARPLHLYRRHGYRETHRTPAGTHELVHLCKQVGAPSRGAVRRARPADHDGIAALLGADPDPAAGRTWVVDTDEGLLGVFTLTRGAGVAVLSGLAVRPGLDALAGELTDRLAVQVARSGLRLEIRGV